MSSANGLRSSTASQLAETKLEPLAGTAHASTGILRDVDIGAGAEGGVDKLDEGQINRVSSIGLLQMHKHTVTSYIPLSITRSPSPSSPFHSACTDPSNANETVFINAVTSHLPHRLLSILPFRSAVTSVVEGKAGGQERLRQARRALGYVPTR